jgi:hypothetical protein
LKLRRLRLSTLLLVAEVEHSGEGANHFSSKNVMFPSSDRHRISLEKSAAKGEPFWNACRYSKYHNI